VDAKRTWRRRSHTCVERRRDDAAAAAEQRPCAPAADLGPTRRPVPRYRTLADGIGGMERRGAAPGGQVAEAAARGGRRGGPARRPSRGCGSGGAAAGGEVEE